MLFEIKTCIFIDFSPNQTHENNSEQNCHSQEEPRAINNYCGKQQRSYNEPTKYSGCKEYCHIIQVPTSSPYNPYGSKSSDRRGDIHSGIITI